MLLFSAGVGLGTAALCLLLLVHDPVTAFLSVGAGLTSVALGLTCSYYRLQHLLWRFVAPLFVGAGCGLLTAGLVLSLTQNSEMTAFIATGVGFLTTALSAFVLFFGTCRPHGNSSGKRAPRTLRRCWHKAPKAKRAKQAPTTHTSCRAALIVAAVVLGLIPAAVFVLYRSRIDKEYFAPSRPYSSSQGCSVFGCRQRAAVLLSQESYAGAGQFDRKVYCETHARQGVWEARHLGRTVRSLRH